MNDLDSSSQAALFSGADMKASFDTAHIRAVHDRLHQGSSVPLVTTRLEHLRDACKKTKPTLYLSQIEIRL